MIANVMTPYRLNLHRLVAGGIPELKLHTLITHGPADFDWKLSLPDAIHTRFFGTPGDSPLSSSLRRPVPEWRKGGQLIEYLLANDIRAVILFGYRYLSYLRVIRFCRRAGIPAFVHNDSNVYGDRNLSRVKRALKARLYRWWLNRVSGVMSMGEYGDQFFRRYGADPQQLYRVPWPVDEEFHARVDEQRLYGFRQKFGLTPGRRYLLFSGRLAPEKRVDLLIDAFAAVAAERPDWDLLIAGDGVLGEQLRGRVPERLRSRVLWTGFLDGDEPALPYGVADVLVLPSDRDGWALVVQEAMAAGLAVVVSHVVGASRDLVKDKQNGRIFTAGCIDELAAAILDVTDPANLERYQHQSRQVLAQWTTRCNPISEIRRALVDSGALSDDAC
jgi:glycosyltransferase involved in cell wall biosynthesis